MVKYTNFSENGRNVVNTYFKLRGTIKLAGIECVAASDRTVSLCSHQRAVIVGLLSSTMKQTWRVMQYLSAHVSFVICQMTEEAQEGDITGLVEIAFLFYSFQPLFYPTLVHNSPRNFIGNRL
jgi:hypothetical protein